MESTKIPKRIIKKQLKKGVIKKQLKKVDKAIVEIAEMKFENYEEKEHVDKQAKNLSGGLKRRLEIARSILHDPKILILDEATSGLDPESRKNILSYIKDLNKDQKLTIISITHLKDETKDVDKVLELKKGKIINN